MASRNRISSKVMLSSFVIAMMSVALSIGCERQSQQGTDKPKASLVGAGSTFSSLLFKNWFDKYHELHPDITVSYDVVGSGEGVRRFMGKNIRPEEEVDFGASDAAMQDDEITQVPGGVQMLPITAGGLVLAYNLPGLNGDLKLSREAYAGIFLGKITKWNDPRIVAANPGLNLPRLDIVTVVRLDSSGTTFAFTKHLDSINSEWHSRFGAKKLVSWPGTAMAVKGNEGVAARIQQAEGSIGYIEYEFSRRLDLKVATLENKQGKYIRPTEEAFVAGLSSAELPENLRVFVPDPAGEGSYPIVTFSWVLLRKNDTDARKAKMLHELFTWCLTDGQHYSSQLGYIPLPENVVTKSLSALNKLSPQP